MDKAQEKIAQLFASQMKAKTTEGEEKAIGQFRLQLNGVFEPFCGKVNYGQGVFVPGAIKEIVKLALLLHRRLNGEDIPIQK